MFVKLTVYNGGSDYAYTFNSATFKDYTHSGGKTVITFMDGTSNTVEESTTAIDTLLGAVAP